MGRHFQRTCSAGGWKILYSRLLTAMRCSESLDEEISHNPCATLSGAQDTVHSHETATSGAAYAEEAHSRGLYGVQVQRRTRPSESRYRGISERIPFGYEASRAGSRGLDLEIRVPI